MIEIRIHGRGGQGGVTLAKLIGTTRYLQGDSVQAFGVYAAERSGAPLQAFCRCDSDPIVNRNMIYEPDHIIVLDPTLIGPGITTGLKAGGWILININEPPDVFAEKYPGYRVATVDATAIARHKLGTKSVPIVNTALLGAAAKLYGFSIDEVNAGLEHIGFVGPNIEAAKDAWNEIKTHEPVGEANVVKPSIPHNRTAGMVSGNTGELPRIQTGDWATQKPKRVNHVPPCNHVCPAGNDVQGFLDALSNENVDEALEILLTTTPFASVCGRVCPGPCMDACNRVHLDEPVNIRELERWAGDHGNAKPKMAPERHERIAVIGGGPAGLSAAYQMRLLGYKVTLYEAGPHLGGLLVTGIPPYRLPRNVLDREIKRILDLGVDAQLNHRINKDELAKLAAAFDGVLVATGLQDLRKLDLGIDDGEVVMQGIDFLVKANENDIRVDDEDVVVVGGGNTAFDAARSALRLGSKSVRMIYRRTRAEMPAIAEEIDEGIEEGVQVDYLTLPVKAAPTSGGGYTITCRRMELGQPDDSGRRRPVEIAGSDFDLHADRVLLALGQSADLSIFPNGKEVTEGEKITVGQTPVMAIGDVATWEGTVTAAIGSGRRTAYGLHQTITGEDLAPPPLDGGDITTHEQMQLHLFTLTPRKAGEALDPKKRRFTYDEIHAELEDLSEAKRCMSCGVCNECDKCVQYCPEGVLIRDGHDFHFDFSYCKGCGVCASECPRNVIDMVHL